MSGMMWLMSANAVFWLGLGAYAVFLACRGRALERRLARLERDDA